MMPTRSQSSCTSVIRWLESRTVQPAAPSRRTSRRMSAMPAGSRPLVGSSRTTSRGSFSSAAATPRRCFMPSEYVAYLSRGPAGQFDLVQHDGDPVVADPGVPGHHPQVVASAQVRVERRSLDQRPDAGQVAGLPGGAAEQPHLTGRRPDESQQHAQGGRLAGAVGSEESIDLARADLEVQGVDGGQRAVPLGESSCLDWCCHTPRLVADAAAERPSGRGSVRTSADVSLRAACAASAGRTGWP